MQQTTFNFDILISWFLANRQSMQPAGGKKTKPAVPQAPTLSEHQAYMARRWLF